ncbi:hypothetical protein [Sporosarcina sp. FSL K6-1508]|uniref:hypothetical protein n=1 Tax=Sporosarcina sp. FSL K6-1508 TaxID=2921553 RepID=UPI0030FC32FC
MKVKYHLFDTSQGMLVSEGDRYQTIHIDNDVELDKHESLKTVGGAIGKEINRSISNIKVLGYELVLASLLRCFFYYIKGW